MKLKKLRSNRPNVVGIKKLRKKRDRNKRLKKNNLKSPKVNFLSNL